MAIFFGMIRFQILLKPKNLKFSDNFNLETCKTGHSSHIVNLKGPEMNCGRIILICMCNDDWYRHLCPWNMFYFWGPFTAIIFTSICVLNTIVKIYKYACFTSKCHKIKIKPFLFLYGCNFLVIIYLQSSDLIHHFKCDHVFSAILQPVLGQHTDIVNPFLK